MANVISDAALQSAWEKVSMPSAGTKVTLMGEITADSDLKGYDLKVITPGLALSVGQKVKFIGFVGATIDTSGIVRRNVNAAFAKPKPKRNGIYAVIEVDGRESKMLIENIINPVTLTGIEPDSEAFNAIKAANEDIENSFQPKGMESIKEVLGWKGQTKEVMHVVKNYSREVLGGAETLNGLSSVWFSA